MSENQETVADISQDVGSAIPDVHRFNAEKLGMPFYVDVGTSVVAIRCTSDHEVIWRGDHVWGGKGRIVEAKRLCAIMNKAAKQPVGNAAKLREAVVLALSLLDLKEGVQCKTVSQKDIDFMKAAIAEPPRQCNVGTAEEQVARYHAFCAKMMKQNNHCCGPCPCYKFVNGEVQPCTLLWAQMPCDESEAGIGRNFEDDSAEGEEEAISGNGAGEKQEENK